MFCEAAKLIYKKYLKSIAGIECNQFSYPLSFGALLQRAKLYMPELHRNLKPVWCLAYLLHEARLSQDPSFYLGLQLELQTAQCRFDSVDAVSVRVEEIILVLGVSYQPNQVIKTVSFR